MSTRSAQNRDAFLATVQDEQSRLVRFCTYLTGDSHAAEDLAQETLLIAWQKRHQITDPDGLAHWLTAIARNVCRHWLRRRSREQTHRLRLEQPEEPAPAINDALADDFDVTVELEREELATLLDQAMALLPAETRTLLVQHYLDSQPQTELAERFGLAPGTVAVRLHRGRLALQRLLLDNFQEEAAAYGFLPTADDEWQRTHIWCFQCGEHRLLGQCDPERGDLRFRCPGCSSPKGTLVNSSMVPFLQGMKAYKPAYKRVLGWIYDYYQKSSEPGVVPCLQCGRPLRVQMGTPPLLPDFHNAIYAWCDRCGEGPGAEGWLSLAQSVPAVRRFWQAHPRMRVLPARTLERDGSPAVATGFESVTDSARIDVVFTRSTFQVIHVET